MSGLWHFLVQTLFLPGHENCRDVPVVSHHPEPLSVHSSEFVNRAGHIKGQLKLFLADIELLRVAPHNTTQATTNCGGDHLGMVKTYLRADARMWEASRHRGYLCT